MHKALTPIVSELRAYGSEIAPTPMDSTTAVAKVDYTPPSLEKLRDTIIDFKERIPEGMRDAAALEKRFAESKEDSINELARLLRELEQHLTDAMLTEEWRDTREDVGHFSHCYGTNLFLVATECKKGCHNCTSGCTIKPT